MRARTNAAILRPMHPESPPRPAFAAMGNLALVASFGEFIDAGLDTAGHAFLERLWQAARMDFLARSLKQDRAH